MKIKKPLTTTIAIIALCALAILPLASCSSEKDIGESTSNLGRTILETAREAGGFESLIAAVEKAGLVGTLDGEGPLTVFAPTDAAFDALLEELGLSSLDEIDSDTLEGILSYHVLTQKVRSSEIPTDPPIADSASGLTLFFDTSDGVEVNEASVVTPDIEGTNGVIHVIDQVLLPPTVVDAARIAGLSSLGTALESQGLGETLRGEGAFTVFAPTNDAFSALGSSTPTGEALTEALLYHVVQGEALSAAAIPNGLSFASSLSTNRFGSPLSLVLQKAEEVRVSGAQVQVADIKAVNGVVHVINQVLAPPTLVDLARFSGLTSLVDALVAAPLKLDQALASPGSFTVLAPTNEAFAALAAVPSGLALTNVLGYHVVHGNQPILASDVPDRALIRTLFGQNLHSSTSNGVRFIDTTGGESTVVIADVIGTNGVAHVIDRVLIPAVH